MVSKILDVKDLRDQLFLCAQLQPHYKPLAAADECFCNCTLLYARATDRIKTLSQAVQESHEGVQQAAALREALRVEAQAEVMGCLTDSNSTRSELTTWGDIAKSLNKECFVEQDTANLLCGILGVTIYIIGNGRLDNLSVTKYAG